MMKHVGFVLHPYGINIVKDKFPFFYPGVYRMFSFLLPRLSDYQIKSFYSKMPPHQILRLNNIFITKENNLSFSLFMIPFFPEQFYINEEKALLALNKIAGIAFREGVDILGLGGFTSIVGNQGAVLAERSLVCVTSGNTFTAALCVNGIQRACKKFNKLEKNLTLAIIGATGDIGSAVARSLSCEFKKIILVARNIDESASIVVELRNMTNTEIAISLSAKEAAQKSDVVFLATSAFETILESEDIKNETIICDASLPYNVSRSIAASRSDVFIFDGGRAAIPFFDSILNSRWKNLFPCNSIYGCLAEAFLLAVSGNISNFSVGRGSITVEKMQYIMNLADKHGFILAPFTCGDKLVAE